MDERFGRVIAIAGSQMTVSLEVDEVAKDPVRIGAMVTVRSGPLDVVGTIAAIQAEGGASSPRSVFIVDLLGEIVPSTGGPPQFRRGLSYHPVAGTPVRAATEVELGTVYRRPPASNISIGTLYHDPRQSAFVVVDERSWQRILRSSERPGPGSRVPSR